MYKKRKKIDVVTFDSKNRNKIATKGRGLFDLLLLIAWSESGLPEYHWQCPQLT